MKQLITRFSPAAYYFLLFVSKFSSESDGSPLNMTNENAVVNV
jgi:hypothetical protein